MLCYPRRVRYHATMITEPEDINALKRAKALLEHPGVAARLTAMIGTPIEKGFAMLPDTWNAKIGTITQEALSKAMHAAVWTMKDTVGAPASPRWHKLAAATSGGVGGFFGLAALAVELPVSTTIMLRSIADIARSEGESVGLFDTQLACLEVFALGGTHPSDDASESGYFAIRAALAQSVSQAASHLAEHGLANKGAPALVRLIVKVAERFSIQVSEKAAAQAIPALGAAGGAAVNSIFIDHFQDMARGHFTIRRLERKYDPSTVMATYRNL